MSNITKRIIGYPNLPNLTRDELLTPFDSLVDEILKSHFPRACRDFGSNFVSKGSYPKINLKSSETSVTLEAAIPGMSKDEISISIKDRCLEISGKKKNSSGSSSGKESFIIREIKKTSFRRSFMIEDDNLDLSNISASVDKGMLTIVLPRIAKKEDKAVYIDID